VKTYRNNLKGRGEAYKIFPPLLTIDKGGELLCTFGTGGLDLSDSFSQVKTHKYFSILELLGAMIMYLEKHCIFSRELPTLVRAIVLNCLSCPGGCTDLGKRLGAS